MKKLVDLSHSIADGMITYPGIPAPVISDLLSREASHSHYADGVDFCINQIQLPANSGTYLDTPYHRYEHGMDLAEMPLSKLADLDTVVCRVPNTCRIVDQSAFAGLDVSGKAVLVHTGWAQHWGSDQYFVEHPYLTCAAAEYLCQQGVVLVGIDSLNIDDTNDPQRPVHSILLAADIPIIEHMCNLENLPDAGFRLHAVPVKIRKFGTFPVRAYAVVGD